MKKGLVAIIFLIAFVFTAQVSFAQLTGIETGYLNIVPESPGPNEQVTATLTSYATDLNAADISWLINGEVVKKGKGIKKISFTTGELGSVSDIEAIAATEDGWSFNKNLTLRPAKVSLIYEPDTYTPPFYRGKPIYTYQGRVRVIALPQFVDENGIFLKPSELIYIWKEKGVVANNASGYGKSVFNFKGKIPFRTNDITVEASAPGKDLSARASLSLTPVEPKVVLYENDPAYGILYNKAIGNNFNLDKDEISIAAVPYFFNTDRRSDVNLNYEWNVNGAPISSLVGNENIVLRKTAKDASGNSMIFLKLSNTKDIYQFINKSLTVFFGENANNAGFFR